MQNETGISVTGNEIPGKYSLEQNYPNPFNPATNIKFSIPLLRGVDGAAGRGVLLKVYNSLGKEVSVLVNEEMNPGSYEVSWDASNYPSGVYFYTLTAGDFKQTKKMLLIK